MPKYFFKPDKPLSIGSEIVLEGDTAFHLVNVLRIKTGDELTLCDGSNTDYIVVVSLFSKKTKVSAVVKNITPCATEPSIKISLYQSLPKGDKLDLIIQKTVELGVTEIIPVVTSRSLVKPKNNKTERYQRIAESAAGQSMRGIVPKVHEPISFNDVPVGETTFVAYEGEKILSFKTALLKANSNKINIWIGPEGGFAPEEIAALTEKGAIPISLGARILRTETAAIATIAQMICLLEG